MTAVIRLAMAQFDFPVGDIAGNAARIANLIAQARDEHRADLVVFPELALSGYPPEDLLLRPSFLADCEAVLKSIADHVHGIIAGGGLARNSWRGGLQPKQRAARRPHFGHVSQARSAQLRRVRRTPLFQHRS